MSRARFEEFHRSRKNRGAKTASMFARLPDDTYMDESVQRHWWTWQSAIKPIQAELEATQAALAAAQKDAERWQQLKWHWEDERDSGPGGRWWTSIHCDGKLKGPEAAIDTALSTTKEKK